MRLRRRGTDGLSTHRWREMDSNFRFRVRCKRGLRRKSPASAAFAVDYLRLPSLTAPSTCQVGLFGCRRVTVGTGFIANPYYRFRPRLEIFGSSKLTALRQ